MRDRQTRSAHAFCIDCAARYASLPRKTSSAYLQLYLAWRRTSEKGRVTSVSGAFLDNEEKLVYGFQRFLAFSLKSQQQRQFEKDVKFSSLVDEFQPVS